MNDSSKVTPAHRQRAAIVYVRQSTLLQLERNKESTARQYDLVECAVALGWSRARVGVVDEDQGHSGSSTVGRSGFAELAAQVGLGQVGIVLALAAMTDTLVADTDGVYHPRRFDDRLVLGMKGTMAEAELHILRARLDGGVRNKAARGELRRALPVGLVWGEGAGEIRLHPDEAVTGVIRAVFERFAACGSARSVWLWLREQDLKWPLQPAPTCTARRSCGSPRPTTRCTTRSPTPPTPAPTSTAAPASNAALAPTARCAPTAWSCPATSGRSSSPTTTRGSSAGRTTWPTRTRSAPTPVRVATNRAPARCARGARCCRAWPPAGPAGASSPSSTRARPRPPRAITAPAPGSWSRAGAPVTCRSAGRRSTPRSPTRSWPRSPPPPWMPACRPPTSWRPATTRRWPPTGARSSAPATTPPGPSAATGPSTPTTAWSPAAWRPTGRKP